MSEQAAAERARLEDDRLGRAPWRQWGTYLSDRQWGTVREDYSADGSAWDYFPHDHARSRAYRWGEDGIGGFCDSAQTLCMSLALWNGADPILKERLFGLTNAQGNHGEDVKELYWFEDALPSGAYQRMRYKYPQRPYPYDELVRVNASRSKLEPEYEVVDTGIFDDARYFDVSIEWAKRAPDDILMRVTVTNRGRDAATIHVLPHVWYRNTWSWDASAHRPSLAACGASAADVSHPSLAPFRVMFDGSPQLLFCDNDTNVERLYGQPRAGAFFKDGINDAVVHGQSDAVNRARIGTRMAAHHTATIAPGASVTFRMRMRPVDGAAARPTKPASGTGARKGAPAADGADAFGDFDAVVAERRAEADAFYASLHHGSASTEACAVQRAAWAGLLWCRQFYAYDVRRWLDGDPAMPPPPASRRGARNSDWRHLDNAQVLCMPDSWEYPWYAAWDHAFHAVALAPVDAHDAKRQLEALLTDRFMHPSGALPAYEWNFDDCNPPVHAWAVWRTYQIERDANDGHGDIAFLQRTFNRLLINFTWWVNRKDATGRNVFSGGFLGLDNIGVFDRSAPLPDGVTLQQADATAHMGMFCLKMMRIAIELAMHGQPYQDMATKFFEHFLMIASAMAGVDGHPGLWDEHEEFFYDRMRHPDGSDTPLRIQSIVGLIPLLSVEVLEPEMLERLPLFKERLEWFLAKRPDLASLVSRWNEPGRGERRLFSLLRGHRMKCLLRHALDESKFLSPHGIRSMSRALRDEPYVMWANGKSMSVRYEPAEGLSGLFGGNSNWRGPIWMPLNYLICESLEKFHQYYGDEFTVECPVGSGNQVTLRGVSREVAQRLLSLFIRGRDGLRPCEGQSELLQHDPHFRDLIRFHEYFCGDTGRGCGASHQTGWTALIARLASTDPLVT
jgi:hypothetical protein